MDGTTGEAVGEIEAMLRSVEAPARPTPRPVPDDGAAGALVPARGKRPAPVVAHGESWDGPPVNDRASTLPVPPVPSVAGVGFVESFPGLPDVEQDAAVIAARKAHADLAERVKANAAEQVELAKSLLLSSNPTDAQIDSLNSAFIVAGNDEADIDRLRALRKRGQVLAGACEQSADAIRKAIGEAKRLSLPVAREKVWAPLYRAAVLAQLAAMRAADELRTMTMRLKGAGLGNGLMLMQDSLPTDGRDRSHLAAVVNDWLSQGFITRDEADAALAYPMR